MLCVGVQNVVTGAGPLKRNIMYTLFTLKRFLSLGQYSERHLCTLFTPKGLYRNGTYSFSKVLIGIF